MKKKGLSSLLATVLLVGVTFIVGVIVILGGTDVQKSAMRSQENFIGKVGIIDFDVNFKDAQCNIPGKNCYRVLIKNNEESKLNFVITTTTNLGISVSGPEEYELNPYSQNIFVVSYPSEMGVEGIYSEVKAIK
jgi:flagellin-like protein